MYDENETILFRKMLKKYGEFYKGDWPGITKSQYYNLKYLKIEYNAKLEYTNKTENDNTKFCKFRVYQFFREITPDDIAYTVTDFKDDFGIIYSNIKKQDVLYYVNCYLGMDLTSFCKKYNLSLKNFRNYLSAYTKRYRKIEREFKIILIKTGVYYLNGEIIYGRLKRLLGRLDRELNEYEIIFKEKGVKLVGDKSSLENFRNRWEITEPITDYYDTSLSVIFFDNEVSEMIKKIRMD